MVDFSKYKDGDDFLQQTGLDIDDALKILKDEYLKRNGKGESELIPDKYPHAKKYLERTGLSLNEALVTTDLELKKAKSESKLPMKKIMAFEPSRTLLIKLGSIAVHAEEMLSEKGHYFDVEVLKTLLNDSDVKVWLAEMNKLALLPKKR